jgi:hypothetical protein
MGTSTKKPRGLAKGTPALREAILAHRSAAVAFANDEHRARGVVRHVVAHRSQDHPLEEPRPVRSDDDKVEPALFGNPADLDRGVAVHHPPVGRPADGGDRALDVGFDLRSYRLVDLSDDLGARRRLGDALDVRHRGARGEQRWRHDAEDRRLEVGQHAGGAPGRLDGELGSVGREENTCQV